MFKDLPEGQTHSFNDGCGIAEHNKDMTDKEFLKDFVKGTEFWLVNMKNMQQYQSAKFPKDCCIYCGCSISHMERLKNIIKEQLKI